MFMFINHPIMLFTITSFLASKCMPLKVLNYTFIDIIIDALHKLKFTKMDFKIDIHSHYFFIMVEYHANRLIAENIFNSEWHTLMEYEHNKILLQGNGSVKSIIIKKEVCTSDEVWEDIRKSEH